MGNNAPSAWGITLPVTHMCITVDKDIYAQTIVNRTLCTPLFVSLIDIQTKKNNRRRTFVDAVFTEAFAIIRDTPLRQPSCQAYVTWLDYTLERGCPLL